MKPIFVYGTLLPGCPNSDLWSGDATVVPAKLAGFRLVSWHGHFPYAIPADDEVTVGALLYPDVTAYEWLLNRLDHLEGVPFHYDRREVVVQVGESFVVAWVYTPNDPEEYEEDRPIPNNDWFAFKAMTKDLSL